MPGWIEIAVVLIILILLFGRGKISDLMSDVAKGITSFKKGLKDEGTTLEAPGQDNNADALMDAEKSNSEKTDA